MNSPVLIDLCKFSSTEQYNIFNQVKDTAYICVLDFYANWCAPCVSLAARIENEIKDHPKIANMLNTDLGMTEASYRDKIIFLKINIDLHDDLADSHSVSKIPHLFIYHNGKLEQQTERNFTGLINHLHELIDDEVYLPTRADSFLSVPLI